MNSGLSPFLWSIVLLTLRIQLLLLLLLSLSSSVSFCSLVSFFYASSFLFFFFFSSSSSFFFLFSFFSSSSSSSSATVRRVSYHPIKFSSIPEGLRLFPACFTFTLHLNHSQIRSSNFTLSPSFSSFYCSWFNFLSFVRLLNEHTV